MLTTKDCKYAVFHDFASNTRASFSGALGRGEGVLYNHGAGFKQHQPDVSSPKVKIASALYLYTP